MNPNVTVMKHQVRTRVPSPRRRGLGYTAAQQALINQATAAWNDAAVASAPSRAAAGLAPATLWSGAPVVSPVSAPTTASYVPYVLAGVLGVAAISAVIYFATE